eukprot:3396967-Prymnesium_polylepis.1
MGMRDATRGVQVGAAGREERERGTATHGDARAYVMQSGARPSPAASLIVFEAFVAVAAVVRALVVEGVHSVTQLWPRPSLPHRPRRRMRSKMHDGRAPPEQAERAVKLLRALRDLPELQDCRAHGGSVNVRHDAQSPLERALLFARACPVRRMLRV